MQIKRDFEFNSKHIRIILMVVVVVLCLLLIINAFRTRDSVENIPEISNETPQLDFLPMEDNTKISFPVGTVRLPEDWTVGAILNSPTGTGYTCVGEPCRLAIISPTVAGYKLVEVIISTPTYVRSESSPELKKTTIITTFAGEEIKLNADLTQVVNVEVNPEGNVTEKDAVDGYYYQLYGCNSKDVCAYATYLSDSPEDNALQVEEFKQLLARLTIE